MPPTEEYSSKLSGEDEREEEANYFAMCLLMPEQLIAASLTKHAPDGLDLCSDHQIQRIARHFGVSVTIATLRLAHLGYL